MTAATASPLESDRSHAVFRANPRDTLYGLAFEGREGVAVGDFGLVAASSDGGRSWARQPAGFTDMALFGVARRGGRCVAVGQQGTVFTAADCVAWKPARAVTEARLLAVDMNANGTAFAVGGFGTVVRSTDWGATWEVVNLDWARLTRDGVEPHLYAVQVDDSGAVTLAGEFELILRSPDGGTTWTALHAGTRSLFAVELLDNGEGYAVGQEGLVLKTNDAGRSWQALASGTKAILTDVFARPDGRVVVSGIYTLLSSTDGGGSWRRDPSRDVGTAWYQSVGGGTDAEGRLWVVAVGSAGEIRAVRE